MKIAKEILAGGDGVFLAGKSSTSVASRGSTPTATRLAALSNEETDSASPLQ